MKQTRATAPTKGTNSEKNKQFDIKNWNENEHNNSSKKRNQNRFNSWKIAGSPKWRVAGD